MKQLPTFHCDACGLPVDPQTMEECPRCHYPVNPAKEEHFLESAIGDLQRVATFGGANLRVVDLIRRYQARLDTLRLLKAVPAPVVAPVPAMYEGAESIPAQSFGPSMQQVQAEEPLESLAPAPPLSPQAVQVSAAPLPGGEQAARRVFSWRSFFADQTINIVASLGAFLILVGSLSFTATTSSLLLSFLVVFLVHAVFGITGFITQRFPNFRVVATIYTVIFALLVPLVGFSAYRLFTGNNSGFSVPALVAITAVYAAIMYTVLAIYQRFIPFAYLGMVALVVADLAVAAAFQLAYWWWPSMAIVLAFPALVAVQRLAGNNWPFAGSWAVLRDPVRLVMYALVSACGLAFLVAPSYSLLLDAFGAPVRELRFALLSLSLLVLLWMGLFLWITRRGRAALVLAYLFLVSVLLFCYALDFEAIGYALALAAVALVYHGLNRFAGRLLQPFGVLSLGLDQLALALVLLEPFISSPLLPLRLFARAYAISLVPFQTGWHTFAELGAVGLGLAITVSVILNRAGAGKTPAKPAWCWLLLLSGFLLNWEYGILVLVLDIEPVWAFLGLGLLMVAVAVLARQLVGAAWANPLDVLALAGSALTLGLSLHQSQDVIGALLLSFAALAYVVLLYQRRQNWLFLPLIGYSLLAFTAAALVIMLVERVPELLLFPAGLAAWAIWQWRPPLDLVALMISYSLICLLTFAAQFTWRIVSPASRWLPATALHDIPGLGGQALVVLVIIGQGGFSAGTGRLVHVGAGALLDLAVLRSWYGYLRPGNVARVNASLNDEGLRVKRLQRARAIQHWCYYVAGLLLALVLSWELSAFGQTRFDVLALAPASYLSLIAVFLMRDETLPGRHLSGQIVSLLGAVLLLLPALWFSFSDSNLLPTLILVGESLALVLLGIATRVRNFILSGAGLFVVGTLRALFLSTPPSLALMALGGTLVAIATALFLVRHRLRVAWTQWE